MRHPTQPCLAAGILLLTWAADLHAQDPAQADQPTRFVPQRPLTRQELDRQEAVRLYGLGLLCLRDDHLLEAARVFEAALRLNSEAAPLYKALIPVYLALDRVDSALSACRKTLELDPGDYQTGFLYARQLKLQGRPKEAIATLVRVLASPTLQAEDPELRSQMFLDLGILYEQDQNFVQAVAAFQEVVEGLGQALHSAAAHLAVDPSNRDAQAQVTELRAQLGEIYERIGRIALQTKEYAKALDAYTKASEVQRDNPGAGQRLKYYLAKTYVGQGNLDKALTELEGYLQTQPQGVEAYELKITILKALGRDGAILPSLLRYVDKDPFNVNLRMLLARQYAGQRQPVQAEEQYLELARTSPTPEVYRGLFTLYREVGWMGKALTLLDEALAGAAGKENARGPAARKVPPNPAAVAQARAMLVALRDDLPLSRALLPVALQHLQTRQSLQFETWRFLAVLASRARQLEVAERLFRQCLSNPVDFRTELDVYAGLLDILWQANKPEAVVEVCREGLARARFANRVLFHRNLARALVLLGKVEEAIAQADEAVKFANPQNRLYCHLTRVIVLRQAQRFDQAVTECQALLKEFNQPGEVREIRYTLSNVYSAAKNPAKAEEQLQLILKADPNDATANNDLGYIWAEQGKNLEEAERLTRKAIDLDRAQKKSTTVGADDDKDNGAFLDSLGWVLFRRGRVEEAREWLEKAAAMPDVADDPVIWDHLGDVYHRLDQPARAQTAWKKALTLFETGKFRKPDERYKDVQHKLKLLEAGPHPR
jgi:tetratricopeptide (TPR) repeat protein